MTLGIVSFAWAALILLMRLRVAPNSYWPLYLLGGAVFGAVSTRVTRNADQHAIAGVLVVLAALALGAIVGMIFLNPGSDIYIEFMPAETFIALTLLPIPVWLFLSSRAKEPEIRDS